jgi:lysophospholipase L1-like esterase
MMRPFSLPWLIPFSLIVLLLASCSDSGDEAADTTFAPTTTEAVTTTTAAPTTTAETGEEPLVLVAFGDSVISDPSAEAGVIGLYAGMLEEEFGVPVDLRNYSVWGSSPTDLLNALDTYQLQEDLEEADVVLLEIPQGDTNPPFPTATGWHGMDPADCGGDDNQQCLRDYVTQNKEDVGMFLWLLTSGRDDGSVPLIRALDVYMLHVEDSLASGTPHIVNPYLQETQEYLEEAAATYGIPVAQVYDEFMGPDGTNDPQDRGLVKSDQRHPTQAGAQLIAEMLHDLGYDLAN